MANPTRGWWRFECSNESSHKDCCIRLVDMPQDCPACGATISVYEMSEGEVEAEDCNGVQ